MAKNGNEFAGFDREMIGFARQHLTGILKDTQEKIARLDGFASTFNFTGTINRTPAVATTVAEAPKRRKMSPAARKRIAAASRKRWAEWRAQNGETGKKKTGKRKGARKGAKRSAGPRRRATDNAPAQDNAQA